jgi:hypothetical protein
MCYYIGKAIILFKQSMHQQFFKLAEQCICMKFCYGTMNVEEEIKRLSSKGRLKLALKK